MSGNHRHAVKANAIKPRSGLDRRACDDRREVHDLRFFEEDEQERRSGKEQRVLPEQRAGWVRVGKWQSICIGSVTDKPVKVR